MFGIFPFGASYLGQGPSEAPEVVGVASVFLSGSLDPDLTFDGAADPDLTFDGALDADLDFDGSAGE
jgi:hypothetical protein